MTTEEVKAEVEAALNALRPMFIPKAELTFIMRVPGRPNTHMVISNDDMSALAEILSYEAKNQ